MSSGSAGTPPRTTPRAAAAKAARDTAARDADETTRPRRVAGRKVPSGRRGPSAPRDPRKGGSARSSVEPVATAAATVVAIDDAPDLTDAPDLDDTQEPEEAQELDEAQEPEEAQELDEAPAAAQQAARTDASTVAAAAIAAAMADAAAARPEVPAAAEVPAAEAPAAEVRPAEVAATEAPGAVELAPEDEAADSSVADVVEPGVDDSDEQPSPSVAVAAAEAAPQPVAAGPSRATDDTTAAASARRRFDPIGAWGQGTRRAVLLGCVAALVVGAIVALALINRSTSVAPVASGAPTPVAPPAAAPVAPAGPAATVRQAETWLHNNVAQSALIAADDDVVAALNKAGYDSAHPLPSGSTPDWHADTYLVVTPAARAQAGRAAPTAAELNSSFPVAVFGTGTDRVEVRKILPGGLAGLAARRAADFGLRKDAGVGLLQNSRVHADVKSARALRAGGVDLRAETLLSLLAGQSDVQITQVLVDPAERAAGQPARTLTIAVSQPQALTTVLNEAKSGFRPLTVTDVAGGSTQLQWDVAVEPMPTV